MNGFPASRISMKIITVKRNDAGQRLDKFLSKAVKGLPMSLMYKYIRTKKIKVNRARTEQKYMLCEGDEIQLFIKDEFFDTPEKDKGALSSIRPKLNIVYEDQNILLLHKRKELKHQLMSYLLQQLHVQMISHL